MSGPICPVCKNGITTDHTSQLIDGVTYHSSCASRVKALTVPMMSDSFRGEVAHPGVMPEEELGKPHAADLNGCRNPVCQLQKDMNRALVVLDRLTGPERDEDPKNAETDARTLLLKHGYYAMNKDVSVTDVTEAR
jgi:hypothetical protein